ncbi:hypothetical protein LSH36_156g07002 [Paralvinella palmiformis]|uniref:C2 domain-containing protein n=1 Tax=Paralvinella palmiformis TaxID=53620 RepID=A0AAD9N6S0_9ANNE|nr:hypothetical protein LSH36_156g07002 [Paralvinella palmiformis]
MTRCCTDVITDNNHPMFEEKFSFELLEDDYKKRVLISILNRTSEGSESEFLGGMSFGVWHIYTHKRTIDGWYYLLHRDIARRKHVQVTVRERDKESLNDVKYSNSDIYATIENGGSKYVEGK